MNIFDLLKNLWDLFTIPKKKPFEDIHIPTDTFPEDNTGIAPGPQQRATDFTHGPTVGAAQGTTTIPYEIILPSGDWRDFLPTDEKQYFPNFDTVGCTDYSNNNTAEIQLKQSAGIEFNFSDRALSVRSGTTKEGNFLYKVADVGRNIGRNLEADYPDDLGNPQSWEEFNKPLPADLDEKLYRFNEAYQWISTDKATLQKYLKQSPIQLIINNNTHAVVLVYIDDAGNYWYYDSYAPFLKKMTTPPNWALQIVVKPITQFVNKKGTQEYGFYAGGVNLADLANVGKRLGYPIIKEDGSAPWDKAKTISFN